MQLLRRCYRWESLGLLASVSLAARAGAETVTITSSPPGPTIEIEGVKASITPLQD